MDTNAPLTKFLARLDRAGVSLRAVCREAGIDPSLVCRWKAGRNEPRLSSIARLEEALHRLTGARK